VSNIYYSYERPRELPSYEHKCKIVKNVVDKLNLLYGREFGEFASNYAPDLIQSQFYFKEHRVGKSMFDLHAEPTPADKDSFGHCVFMLYLSDEVDGAIICPSKQDAADAGMINNEFKDGVKGITIDWCKNTIETIPKVNRCIVMKTGTPHYVPPCSGRRKCITGWSFLDKLPTLKTLNVS